MVWIQNQLVGAVEGDEITLECHSEAYPKSINYWTRDKGDIIAHGNSHIRMSTYSLVWVICCDELLAHSTRRALEPALVSEVVLEVCFDEVGFPLSCLSAGKP